METDNVPSRALAPSSLQTAPKKTTGGRKRRFALFQWLIVAALVGLVWYGFGRNVLAPVRAPVAPHYIGSLKLVRQVEGAPAMAEINRLHGTAITLTTALIAEYGDTNEHLTVWVGGAGSEAAAAELINRMVKGIEKGGAGFTNPRRVTVAGRDLWQADGAGAKFFFYTPAEAADRVVWLTISGGDTQALLERAIKLF